LKVKFTKEEFEAYYAANMGMTVEQLRAFNAEFDRMIAPCACEYEECRGWQMISAALYAEEQQERARLHL
jgi:hypothetical protein